MLKKDRQPTQREINALETKRTLFNTALKMFSNYGYENVTVDEITSHAGVSKGTFYNHFASKESVLMEQFKEIDHHYDEVLGELPANASAKDKIIAFSDTMTHYCAEVCGIEFMKIVYASQISNSRTIKILNNKDRRLYYHLDDIVVTGRNNGEFKCRASDEYLLEMLARTARGIIYDWCLYGGDEFDLVEEGRKNFLFLYERFSMEV